MLTRSLITRLIPALLLVVPLHGINAQGVTPPAWWSDSTGRALERLYTRVRLEPGGGRGRMVLDGIGARVMWSAAPRSGANDLASRSAVGLFATYTPERRPLGISTLHAGAMLDVRPLATSLIGRVDPVLSLGAGVFHTDVDGPRASRVPLTERTHTTFAFSPGIGARIGLWRGIGLRGDVRDVITFRGETHHNVALDVGFRLAF